jgi:hypothetical protein
MEHTINFGNGNDKYLLYYNSFYVPSIQSWIVQVLDLIDLIEEFALNLKLVGSICLS